MNHPDDLLADYVGGTLLGRDLERVRSHLATCRRCREETALASAGRRAATSLPAPAVPQALGDAAIREAEQRVQTPGRRPLRDARRRQAPPWYRWAGVAAAAAAVLVVAVIVLPNVGQGPSGTGGAERAAATASPTGPPVLELQHANYDTSVAAGARSVLRCRDGVLAERPGRSASRDVGKRAAAGRIALARRDRGCPRVRPGSLVRARRRTRSG